MCRTCWGKYDSPKLDSPEIRQAAKLINSIYETEGSGCPLHIQLDDWNIEGNWEPWEDHRGNLEDNSKWEVAEELCVAMNAMDIPSRASALALASGYFS